MNGAEMDGGKMSVSKHPSRYDEEHMHSFQINDNLDLIIESNDSSNSFLHVSHSEKEMFSSDARAHVSGSTEMRYPTGAANGLRVLNAPVTAMKGRISSNGQLAREDRVSEWLWTLHRIGNFICYLQFFL